MAGTTFDLATKSAVTLSGGNLVATNTGTTSTNQGAKGVLADAKSTGKYYFEFTVTNFAGGGGVTVGVAPSTSLYSDQSSIPPSNAATVLIASGNIWNHTGNSGYNVGTVSNGSVIGLAANLDDGRLFFRLSPSGTWKPDGSSPSSTTGGFVIVGPALPYVTFGSGLVGGAGVSGNVITANFGDSAFSGAVPSGYTSGWPSGVVASARQAIFFRNAFA